MLCQGTTKHKNAPVIPDPVRNPGVKDLITAFTGMTIYFPINPQSLINVETGNGHYHFQI